KTVGLEVAEQLGWSLPEHVVVPIASGALLTKVHQGFGVLGDHGLGERAPAPSRSAAARWPPPSPPGSTRSPRCGPAASSSPWASGTRPTGPRPWRWSAAPAGGAGRGALAAVRAPGGRVEAVDDDEVVEAIQLLARTTGVFGETAAGVTIATLRRLANKCAVRPGH